MLRFQPSDDIQTKCTKVGIIGDTVVEPTEQFSVKLTSVSPEGTFIQDTSCISILDDDRKLSIANLNRLKPSSPYSLFFDYLKQYTIAPSF